MAVEGMQRLNTASSFQGDGDPQLIKVKYRTGAKFEGKVIDHKRSGRGLFVWPNGSKYDGDFSDNLRHGKGTQVWSDGSSYTGDFVNDLRHGKGSITWSNGETYEGIFFKDRRHGYGLYTWPDGSSYQGTFYMDKKEGYGTFKFSSGDVFQGLYREDEREGPGVVTYKSSDQQDVGLWRGEKLIKLCSRSPSAFSISAHPEFNYRPEENIIYMEDVSYASNSLPSNQTANPQNNDADASSQLAPVKNVLHPPAALDYPPSPDLTQKINELYSEALDPRSLAVDRLTFDQEFFRNLEEHAKSTASVTKKGQKTVKSQSKTASNNLSATSANTSPTNSQSDFSSSSITKTPVWNATPAMIALQRHTLKHGMGKFGLDLDIDAVIRLDRSKFKAKGPLECHSEELIEAAGAGDASKVETLLSSGKVHPDVADRKGHTALIGATVNWHMDVINVLLNQGANVNKLSDEGCSALSAGTIFYYPMEGFLYNIAERYMSPPDEDLIRVDAESPGQPAPPPGILANNKERRASRLNQINRIKLDSKGGIRTVSLSDKKKNHKKEVTSEKGGVKILKSRPSKNIETDLVAKVEKSDADIFNNDNDDDDDDDNVNIAADDDRDSAYGGEYEEGERPLVVRDGEEGEEEGPEEFESNQSMRNYHIEVTEQLVERCATQLSHNELVVSREVSSTGISAEVGKARRLAIQMSHHERMKETLDLLLRRGADPNASAVPMPVLFFAIKSADVDMVKQLLIKGANTNSRLSAEKGGLYPIHIAAAIPGEEGVQITELLLDALADPNARALEDDSFLNRNLEEEWSKDVISDESRALLGGRTALQVACARDDNYKNSCRVVRLLLEHKADTSLICNGFSPLTLAIASGNDLAIDELLSFGADPSLPLTHGVGSALCVASSKEHEHRRTIQGQIHLVDKLVKAGANILAPIPIGVKRITGTAVDYAYYMFNQDRRIAHMPYHALTHAERETYNARRKLLAHIGDIMRNKAVEREKRRTLEEEKVGSRSQSPSPNFVYIGAGAKLPPGVKSKAALKANQGHGQVKFESPKAAGADQVQAAVLSLGLESGRAPSAARSGVSFVDGVDSRQLRSRRSTRSRSKTPIRKPLFKYCYECGRSVGVRLAACTRCKEVYYCSKACKLKAWNARHKEECIRIGGRSRSPSPRQQQRAASPTGVTRAGQGKPEAALRINHTAGAEGFNAKSLPTLALQSASDTPDGARSNDTDTSVPISFLQESVSEHGSSVLGKIKDRELRPFAGSNGNLQAGGNIRSHQRWDPYKTVNTKDGSNPISSGQKEHLMKHQSISGKPPKRLMHRKDQSIEKNIDTGLMRPSHNSHRQRGQTLSQRQLSELTRMPIPHQRYGKQTTKLPPLRKDRERY
ncbi:hypothetical protein PoB_000050300, partial [Plakobranchus ocellatus]